MLKLRQPHKELSTPGKNQSCESAGAVQETADNKLVILHDLERVLKVSAAEAVNSSAIQAIRQQGVRLEHATVKVKLLALSSQLCAQRNLHCDCQRRPYTLDLAREKDTSILLAAFRLRVAWKIIRIQLVHLIWQKAP